MAFIQFNSELNQAKKGPFLFNKEALNEIHLRKICYFFVPQKGNAMHNPSSFFFSIPFSSLFPDHLKLSLTLQKQNP